LRKNKRKNKRGWRITGYRAQRTSKHSMTQQEDNKMDRKNMWHGFPMSFFIKERTGRGAKTQRGQGHVCMFLLF
jgi:hypothetical protein